MIRTIGERFGGWIGRQHSARGVDTRFGIGIDGLVVGQDGRVSAVNLSDGTQVACDAVVVGIGIVPAVDLARDAGLAIGNGIIVDQQCRTSNRSEEHTSELQSLMRNSYAVFCWKKKTTQRKPHNNKQHENNL